MHTHAWLAWTLLVMTVALSSSNPLYLAVVLLCVLLVAAIAPREAGAATSLRILLLFGVSTMALSLVIAMVNGSYGEHILFTIPGPSFPRWLGGLSLGGPVSAEGLVAAAIRALSIFCVLTVFAVFNSAVSPQRVLRTAPAMLFHAGLAVTIGLTLLPSSIDDLRRIREMRALRGAPTGLHAMPGLIVPAVIGGLERSMKLAEAMEARGYAAQPGGSRAPALMSTAAAPLLTGTTWVWFYYRDLAALAALAAVAAFALLAASIALASRGRRTTTLREERRTPTDTVAVVVSLLLAATVIAAGSSAFLDLDYNPFAGLDAPQFAPLGAAVALACAWPALVIRGIPSRLQAERALEPEGAAS